MILLSVMLKKKVKLQSLNYSKWTRNPILFTVTTLVRFRNSCSNDPVLQIEMTTDLSHVHSKALTRVNRLSGDKLDNRVVI